MEVVERRTGLSALDATAREALAARAVALAGDDAAGYLDRLEAAPSPDDGWTALLDGIANTQTSFLREPELFGLLEEHLSEAHARCGRPLRLWSAAMSSGEEVYSLALCARRAGVPCEILGTDLLETNVARARAGRYAPWSLRNVEPEVLQQFFEPDGQLFRVGAELRQGVRFAVQNLLDPPPRGPWDLILCCNVLIYFERERVPAALEALSAELAPEGRLLLGASESFPVSPGLERVLERGRLMLRRSQPGDPEARPAPAPLPPLAPLPPAASMVAAPGKPTRAEWVTALVEGHLLLARHAFDAAQARYQQAVNLQPENWEPEFFMGLLCRKRGQLEEARNHLSRALFLAPNAWWISYQLAGVHRRMGDLEGFRYERLRTLRILESPADAPAFSSPDGLVDPLVPGAEAVRRALGSLEPGGKAS